MEKNNNLIFLYLMINVFITRIQWWTQIYCVSWKYLTGTKKKIDTLGVHIQKQYVN